MEMKAVKFKNFSDEDFTWKENGVPYTFKAGQEMYLEDWKAKHFAKHLVDRELNKKGISTGIVRDDDPSKKDKNREAMEAFCFPSYEVITPAEALNLNEIKKAKKTKKVVEEFPDLNK